MNTAFDRLVATRNSIKKVQVELEAYKATAEQKPLGKKVEDKLAYYRGEKAKKEKKNEVEIKALESKRDSYIAMMDEKINALKNCTTIAHYDAEIERLLDSNHEDRQKTKAEIQKEMELEDLKKQQKKLEEEIENEERSKKWYEQQLLALERKKQKEIELRKQEEEYAYWCHQQILANNPVSHTLDDEDDYM